MATKQSVIVTAKANEAALAELVVCFSGAKTLVSAAKKLKGKREGMYQEGMVISAKLTSAEEAHATWDALTDNIAFNKGGVATKVGAEKRKEETADGKTHKIPDVISNVKATILYAFDNGISLYKKDGKTLDSYSAIRSARTAHKAKADEEAKKLEVSKLTGLDLERFNAEQSLGRIITIMPLLGPGLVSEVQAWANKFLEGMNPAKAQPKADASAELVAEAQAKPEVPKAKAKKAA